MQNKTDFAKLTTEFLIKENKTITFMESCTSGLLASKLTDTEGASAIFKGSLVTYSNEMKISAGVPSKIIDKYGVYSAECAKAMADTVQKIYGTDITVGITGTTGNVDPLNNDSVKGQAFFCIKIKDKSYDFFIEENVSALSRMEIKQLYAQKVFESLFKLLEQKDA